MGSSACHPGGLCAQQRGGGRVCAFAESCDQRWVNASHPAAASLWVLNPRPGLRARSRDIASVTHSSQRAKEEGAARGAGKSQSLEGFKWFLHHTVLEQRCWRRRDACDSGRVSDAWGPAEDPSPPAPAFSLLMNDPGLSQSLCMFGPAREALFKGMTYIHIVHFCTQLPSLPPGGNTEPAEGELGRGL